MSDPVRILNLFTIMNRGGAETMVMNYYRNIDRTKVQFDFMVHREERGAYDDEIEALGGKIYRMPPVQPGYFREYKAKIAEFFDEHEEYSIIHSHMSELGYYVFKEAKSRGIKCTVCHAHNAPHFSDETFIEKVKDIVRNYFKHKIRKYVDHMFICGIEAGDWLFGKENSDRFVMMNNAVDARRFSWDEQKAEEVRKRLELGGKFVVCHVGRFNSQKNHTFLIDIFKEINEKNKNAVLLLVGAGELEEKIRQKVSDLQLD
ncbi:MAG: glycosyltransferase, partial [Clostridia bacterium]|nr:glycosyltransferase [Clostridia bacterium]